MTLDLPDNSTLIWYKKKLNFDCFYSFYNTEVLNLLGQNIVPNQILAYYIEKWPIESLPQFGNSRRILLKKMVLIKLSP